MSAGRAVVLRGDARRLPLPDGTADLICTSPPYFGLRSYTDDGGHYPGQIGSEATPGEWLAALLDCTREWIRVLKPTGSLFVNLGDKYAGSASGGTQNGACGKRGTDGDRKRGHVRTAQGIMPQTDLRPKSLLGLPWRYALACTDDLGLILRRDIIWDKPNGLPESVTDRCRSSHEYVFHLVKQPRYYAAVDEIREAPTTKPQRRFSAQPVTTAGNADRVGGWSGHLRDVLGQDAHPFGKLPGSVWTIPSAPLVIPARLGVDHFAAYPPELCRRIILGWSPPGICMECGEGRRPVVERPGLLGGDNNPESRSGTRRRSTLDGGQKIWEQRIAQPDTITGYACACPKPSAPVRPAIVVDPFAGTGTTMLAASVLGRTGIGIDRSGAYCRAAQWRTRDPGERSRVIGAPKPPPVADGQGELFDPLEAL